MARPTKSVNVKKAQGTFRPGKEIIHLDLQPLGAVPVAPAEFDERERWFYDTVCEALFNSGLLRSADLMTIESMAGWWSIMKKSQKSIRDEGMIQTAKSGWKQVTPAVNIFEKAWNKLKDFSDRYGFNLISKDKISAPVKRDLKADRLKEMAG
jgi:P27 family predicted phage terminase small subunit